MVQESSSTTKQVSQKKVLSGVVVSNKMAKTVVVAVTRQVLHPVYGKYVKRTSKFMAHDEASTCKIGDTVSIVETRPLSRRKRWMVVDVKTESVVVE